MAKFFAVIIIVIAIASAIPILRHIWVAPEDISTHGALIDEQMSETMAEAGISFLAAQFILALFIWQYSNRRPDAPLKTFPGGAKGLVIAAMLLVGGGSCGARNLWSQGLGGRILHATVGQRYTRSSPSRPVRVLFPLSRSRWDIRPHSIPSWSTRARRISTVSIPTMMRIPRTTS